MLHLLGTTKLDKEKNQCIRGKNGSVEHSKGNDERYKLDTIIVIYYHK